ncbi:MAG: hypothetical protein ACI87H_002529 [Gammaproteobacteria bacterium]|jgi:hypothetical protein
MKVIYTEIERAFGFVNSGQPYEQQAFLNRETGIICWHSDLIDNEEELSDDIDDEKYIELPHKKELGLGKRLVLDFAGRYLPDEFEKIEAIFRRKGAYSRFKGLLEHKGFIDKWSAFEADAEEQALRDWCQFNEIENYP